LGILASFYGSSATAEPVDPTGQELVAPPIQTITSPSEWGRGKWLSAVFCG
jgi:hypothetical protein